MNNPPAMFWSGETLNERLKTLIEPFVPGRVDCAAYTLSIGPEIYWDRIARRAPSIVLDNL